MDGKVNIASSFFTIIDQVLDSVTGVLKGYDQLLNLVLDDVEEDVEREDYFTHEFIDLQTETSNSF